MPNNKHLTLSERSIIEAQLGLRTSFKLIALSMDKDPSTISKEVRAHMVITRTGAFRKKFNACSNRFNCLVHGLCQPCNAGRNYKYCRDCGMCNRFCPDFSPVSCELLSKPPYVCNGCKQRPFCTLEKHFYEAKVAHDEYRKQLVDLRLGISYCEEDIAHINSIVTPLVKQGQSIHHVCITNSDALMVSERTIYRLIDNGLLSVKNLDLPRKVRFKARKKKKPLKLDRKCRIGRDYDAFLNFMEQYPDSPVTQIDSVEGRKGGKVLLTIHFVKAAFMLAYIRDYNDSRSVTKIFNYLYDLLGDERFKRIFKVILTDNGSEFSNPVAIEVAPDGAKRTQVFYCDPNAPYQKGAAERNHEFIRYFLPHGKSFDHLNQSDIDKMMDNINSYCRESLSDKCPYDMFSFLYGQDILDLLGCHKIPPQDVTLNKSVFKKGGENLDL